MRQEVMKMEIQMLAVINTDMIKMSKHDGSQTDKMKALAMDAESFRPKNRKLAKRVHKDIFFFFVGWLPAILLQYPD